MQTSIRLPSGLHERLSKAAGSRGIGEEIRERLEASFASEQRPSADPKTCELALAVAALADYASEVNQKSWHEDRYTFDLVDLAVGKLLASYSPKGEPTPNPESLLYVLYDKDTAPSQIAAMMVAVVIDRIRRK